MLTAVQTIDDDHKSRAVAKETVHTAGHLTHPFDLLLQVLHEAFHLERIDVFRNLLHTASRRYYQVYDHTPPGVYIGDECHTNNGRDRDENTVDDCVLFIGDTMDPKEGKENTDSHSTKDDDDHNDEVGNAADRLKTSMILHCGGE